MVTMVDLHNCSQALMEVLTHISGDYSNVTRIKNIYDVWMRKIGLPKGRQVEVCIWNYGAFVLC